MDVLLRIPPWARYAASCGISATLGAVVVLAFSSSPVKPAGSPARAPLRFQPAPAATPSSVLGDRERAVLARLAQLPDLPTHHEPVFDLPTSPDHSGKPRSERKTPVIADSSTSASSKSSPVEGKTMLVQIEVISIENGCVYYRAVDGITHVAKTGERLLGVNGRVISVRKDQAELQIDGEKLTISAANT